MLHYTDLLTWGNFGRGPPFPISILLYFFCYKTELFSFQNNSKDLDGSKSLGLFWKGKTRIIGKFHRTGLDICSQSREGKTCLIAEYIRYSPITEEYKE